MENEKLDAVLKSFAALVSPYIMENVVDHLVSSGFLTTEVNLRIQEKIDDLGKVDQDMIEEIVRSELSDMELVDEDRARELAREEVDDIDLTDNSSFEESVERIVRGMSFSVEIG